MTYEIYIKQPMQMVELRMNVQIDNDRHLLNAPDRKFNLTLIQK